MRDGDVVIVTGKLATNVRENEERIGTYVFYDGTNAWVLFSDGVMWVGPKNLVFPYKEHQIIETKSAEPIVE
jgi:hypothetical protein